MPIIEIGIIAGSGLAALLILGLIFARLYRRATKEISFVRTGFGGEKVVMNGGALILPVLHETIPVNMNTLRLAVERKNEQALITKDRMRVDVLAEFYVRVQPSADAISSAAQTLGLRTMQPEELKDLVEGKFVDALRSVAAELTMTELHEQRTHFVQKVQQVSSEDLLKNGLELETVSLTGLDQTAMEFFNPSNAFDAEGLTRLTEEIEHRKKLRNDIEQDTQVQIKNKNLEAERQTLTITRDAEYARLEQQREIEIRRAQQSAEVAREQAEKNQAAEAAKITAQQQTEQAKIEADRAVAQERLAMEQQVREREIAKERAIETQNVEKAKAVELAEQDRAIAIAERSKAQSEAQALADSARALAVQAEERVTTVRQTEVADRQKAIELIEAAQEAERQAIGIRVAAEAEKTAAADKAEALREQARGEADRIK
ncbi:MAG TPA: SPFH domain-containing protein, partial [Phenylobacterium sp.]